MGPAAENPKVLQHAIRDRADTPAMRGGKEVILYIPNHLLRFAPFGSSPSNEVTFFSPRESGEANTENSLARAFKQAEDWIKLHLPGYTL